MPGPAEIVQAAYDVFSEKGFAAARLDDIAKRAGVSKGALYLYFETKQDIFEAVVKDAVAPNIGAIEQFALNFPGPFEQLIRMMIPRVAEMANQSGMGKVIKMVIGESGNFPEIARIWHDDIVGKGLGLMTALIATGTGTRRDPARRGARIHASPSSALCSRQSSSARRLSPPGRSLSTSPTSCSSISTPCCPDF